MLMFMKYRRMSGSPARSTSRELFANSLKTTRSNNGFVSPSAVHIEMKYVLSNLARSWSPNSYDD